MKNKSKFEYGTKGGGDYVEVAFNSFGITDEQLIVNLAHRLSTHSKAGTPLNWYPTVKQLLEEKRFRQLLLRLLSAMKKKHGHKELSEEYNPVLQLLASLIPYFMHEKEC